MPLGLISSFSLMGNGVDDGSFSGVQIEVFFFC